MASDKITLKEFVAIQFDTITKKIDCLDSKLSQARIDIATLKVKAGVWGAIAGIIPASIMIIYWLIRR